jgi:outer membrane lipoprotein-sorting protein
MKLTQYLRRGILVFVLGTFVNGAGAQQWTFDDLMANLSNHSKFSADFDEDRTSMFLKRPIKLKGRLIFDAETSLEKIVSSPFEEHIIIDNDAVVIHRYNTEGRGEARHTTRYALANYPFLAKAIQGVSNVFAGDKELLEELYNWELGGDEEAWELVLTPKDEKLADFITTITIRGSQGLINYIHTLEADSDESKLTLTNRTEP